MWGLRSMSIGDGRRRIRPPEGSSPIPPGSIPSALKWSNRGLLLPLSDLSEAHVSKTFCRVLPFLLCLAIASSVVYGQTTAQLSGQVTDQSGAAVAGAKVQVTNLNTNAVRATETTPEGNYSVTALPIGPYKLEGSKEGFQSYAQSGIVLQVNTNPTVNVTLKLGNVQQTVEVQANAGMVETRSEER